MLFPWLRWSRSSPLPPSAPAPSSDPPVARLAPWHGRILIVEDDVELWPALERYSTRAKPGLQLDFVPSVQEAELRLASYARYDVVVTDCYLPEREGGNRVLESTIALQPWARVGMMSGQSDAAPDGTPFLPKPFTPVGYRCFLRELLGWMDATTSL